MYKICIWAQWNYTFKITLSYITICLVWTWTEDVNELVKIGRVRHILFYNEKFLVNKCRLNCKLQGSKQ